MPEFPELLLLRHGETEWNRLGRMQGGLDSPLTDTGRDQARAQNTLISNLNTTNFHWFSSPQGRALETARIVSMGRGGKIQQDDRLREIDIGEWSGLNREDIQKIAPHLFADRTAMSWYGQAPGGERLEDLADRLRAFMSDLPGPAVIVTHGITSRMIRCIALGLPPTAFSRLGGGQGLLYRVSRDVYEQIGPQGTVPQTRDV